MPPNEIIDGYITLSAPRCFSGAFMDIMLTRGMIMAVTDQHGNCSTFRAQNKLSLTYLSCITGSENKIGWAMHINYNTEDYSLMCKMWRDGWEWIKVFWPTGLNLKHWCCCSVPVLLCVDVHFIRHMSWEEIKIVTTIPYKLHSLGSILLFNFYKGSSVRGSYGKIWHSKRKGQGSEVLYTSLICAYNSGDTYLNILPVIAYFI